MIRDPVNKDVTNPQNVAVDAEPKPVEGKSGKGTRRRKPDVESTVYNVTELAWKWDKAGREHASRNNYYGFKPTAWTKNGNPRHFSKAVVDAAIAERDAKARAKGELSTTSKPNATGQAPDTPSPAASELPFDYQPGSAVRAGLSVSPGFEHVSIKEFERATEEAKRLRRTAHLEDPYSED